MQPTMVSSRYHCQTPSSPLHASEQCLLIKLISDTAYFMSSSSNIRQPRHTAISALYLAKTLLVSASGFCEMKHLNQSPWEKCDAVSLVGLQGCYPPWAFATRCHCDRYFLLRPARPLTHIYPTEASWKTQNPPLAWQCTLTHGKDYAPEDRGNWAGVFYHILPILLTLLPLTTICSAIYLTFFEGSTTMMTSRLF
jgi:hypothetical protein